MQLQFTIHKSLLCLLYQTKFAFSMKIQINKDFFYFVLNIQFPPTYKDSHAKISIIRPIIMQIQFMIQ